MSYPKHITNPVKHYKILGDIPRGIVEGLDITIDCVETTLIDGEEFYEFRGVVINGNCIQFLINAQSCEISISRNYRDGYYY